MCALLNLKVLLMWSEMMLSEFITFALSSSPEIIKKLKKKKFQNSILDVWQDSEYANEYGCKILAIYYWWALWSIEINGCIGTKIFTSSLLPVSSVWFFKHQDSFFFIFFIILYHSCYRYCYCQGCCVFLASTLNFFCFIGNAVSLSSTSHHQRLI